MINKIDNKKKKIKMEIQVIETKNYIKFINLLGDDDDDFIYRISKDALDDTLLKYDIIHSYWVYHLSEFDWINIDLLYKLAFIIQREYPTSKIDWNFQFYLIECNNYNCLNYSYHMNSKVKINYSELSAIFDSTRPNRKGNFTSKTTNIVEDRFDHLRFYGESRRMNKKLDSNIRKKP